MVAKIKTRHHPGSHLRTKPRGVSSHAFEQVYWPYLPLIAAICLLMGLAIKSGPIGNIISNPSGKVLSYATSTSLNDLLTDTNVARSHNHQAPLRLNSDLDVADQAKANDMATRDYWSHVTPDGAAPWTFVSAEKYNYQKLGENLATGFPDDQAVINAWLASPAHRQNLLDSNYDDIGFGFANVPDYIAAGGGPMTVIVAFYGQPAGAVATSPTVINSDAATTNNLVLGKTLGDHTSRLQLALANSWLAPWASGIGIAVLAGAVGLWLGRHFIRVKKAFRKGERLVVSHPLMDIGFLVVIILAFVLSRGVGSVL